MQRPKPFRLSLIVTLAGLGLAASCASAAAASSASNAPLSILIEAARGGGPLAPGLFTAEAWMRETPGVALEGQGYLGPQSDLRIRGGAFNAAGYTLGGVALRNPQTEHFHADLPLPAALLRPPRLLTGAEGFATAAGHPSGTVDFDFAPAVPGGRLTLGGGPHGHRLFNLLSSTALPGGGPDGAPLLSLFAARDKSDRSDGWYDNALSRWLAGGHLQLPLAGGRSDAVLAVARRRFGARGFYGTAPTLPAEESLRDIFSLATWSGELAPETDARLTLHARQVEDRYLLDRDDPGLYANRHRSDVAALHGDVEHRLTSRLALDSRFDLAGERIDSRHTGSIAGGALGQHRRMRAAGAAAPVYRLGDLTLRAGAAWEGGSDGSPVWLPVAAVAYAPSAAQTFFVSWSESAREPSYTELNYESPGSLGQAGLARQRLALREAGWRLREERLDLRVTLFAEEGRDTIDWVRTAPGERWTAVNLDALETRGLALAASGEVGGGVTLTLDYLGLEKRCDSEPYASRYALDYARHVLHAGLRARLSRHCLLEVRQGFARQRANAARAGSDTRLDGAARLAVELPGTDVSFELGVDNLFDRDFQIYPGQPPAGRRWVLAANVRW